MKIIITLIYIMMSFLLGMDGSLLAQQDTELNHKLIINDLRFNEEHEAINIDMVIPVIDGMENNQLEDKINQNIQKYAYHFKEELYLGSEEYLKDAKKEGWQIRKYQASSYYIVHYQSKEILSISIFYDRYTLGAHGYTLQKTYNINLKNGEFITLSAFCSDLEKVKKVINQEIKRQIQLSPELYFNGGKVFESISDNQPFYIIDNGIVIFFGLYEISPYAYGIRYFKIPLSLIEANMNFNI